jgi:hypothetical protein
MYLSELCYQVVFNGYLFIPCFTFYSLAFNQPLKSAVEWYIESLKNRIKNESLR